MRYNDISVLENFHIAQTFKLLSQDQYNILKHFKPEEYRILIDVVFKDRFFMPEVIPE